MGHSSQETRGFTLTKKTRPGEFERFHREHEQATSRQIWIRFGGKTKPTEMRTGKTERLEGEIREKIGLGEKTELHMVSEGGRVD